MSLEVRTADPPKKRARSIRVVNLLPDPRVGGPQRRVALVAREIRPLGYETIVVIPPGQAARFFENQGVQCVPFEFPRLRISERVHSGLRFGGGFALDAVRLAALLRDLRADILHCNGLLTLIGPPAARLAGTATVWHLNDMLMPRAVHRALLAGFGGMVDRIAVSSQAVGRHALDEGVPRVVLYPPAELDRHLPANSAGDRTAILSSLGLDPERPTIVTVGHFNAAKGHRHLLEAITLLRADGRHVQALLVGERTNARVADALEAQIAREGLSDCVRLVGGVDDVERVLTAADVFVFPSLSESMGMALLEAMAAGLPVVSTDVGGVAEAVVDGIGGLLAPPGDSLALAKQIKRMLSDPEASRRMGQNAKDVAVERFSTRAVARKHAELYCEMVEGRQSPTCA